MQKRFNGRILTLAMFVSIVASAATISPTSYIYTGGTPSGEASYQDASLTKLTDGNTGTTATLDGTWVGWQRGDLGAANITFNFASSATITAVAFDFLRSDGANTQLPDSVTIGGINFITTNFATNDTQGFVQYSGSWTGTSLAVTLNHTTNHWLFVNEAQFTTGASAATGAPEPASVTLVSMAFGALMFARMRIHRRKVG